MSDSILVTGGTGTLGSHVVPMLRRAGCDDVRVLSRKSQLSEDPAVSYVVGDLESGDGVQAAVAGVSTILHLAGSAKGDDLKAGSLVRAAAAVGVPHLVYVSVVGADRVPVHSGVDRAMFGYYAAKYAAEKTIAESGLPWTTLRATQFHDFVLAMAAGVTKLPIAPVFTGMRFQPIAAEEVAERLVELALGAPAGLVPDLGGSRAFGMDELVRSYLQARGRHRLLLPVRGPGGAARAMRAGANLTLDRAVGRRSWDEFLAAHLAGNLATAQPPRDS
jgi:uncharacterized protein YbjT (DUF2867 family)